MTFKEYQELAKKTIQLTANPDHKTLVPFLGIIGEVGSVVTQLKISLKDGDSFTAFERNLKEELGDVLWYISTIATEHDLNLEEIAKENLVKVNDRFNDPDPKDYPDFDKEYPELERLPDEFEIEFIPIEEDGKSKMKIIHSQSDGAIGDPLTDNNYEDDGYRFHDIFHYGYLAILGWSPVLRKLMKRKRKSRSEVDENEDGARAQITEELISLFIYHHAIEHDLLKYSKSVDSGIIKRVQSLASNTEAKRCGGRQWEKAILSGYRVFNQLRANNGGRVLVSKKNRKLLYIGNN